MHDALSQARVVARAFERARAERFGLRAGAVVEEDQIQIGAEAELAATETAVTEDRQSRRLVGAIGQAAVLRGQVALGQPQHAREHRLGDTGQRPRRGDGVQTPGEKVQADPERGGQPLILDHLDLRLGVDVGQRGQAPRDLGLDRVAVRHGRVVTVVEQLVEQQRMGGHPIGQERAGREHARDALQRAGLLVEQGQIGRAARHRMHQTEQAHQARRRRLRFGRRGEQRRHDAVQTRAGARRG